MNGNRKKIVFVCFISCCIFFCCGCQKSVSILKQNESMYSEQTDEYLQEGLSENSKDDTELQVDMSEEDFSEEQITIYVDVSGAVISPGVYELPENSRVFQAIEAAGGYAEDAEISMLNQAEIIQDGQKIYVYTTQEAEERNELSIQESNDSAIMSDGKININKASKEDLMTLPGIGETRAEAILSYREEHGLFSSVEELMNVEGIKEKTYEKLKDKITAF